MKKIKTYESFLDFFKRKKKEQKIDPIDYNKLVMDCIRLIMQEIELSDSEIKRNIKRPSGEIEFNYPLISLNPPYIAKYEINLENPNKIFSKLIISKCLGDGAPGWTKEAELRWINDGAFLGNNHDIYKIEINGENIICDPEIASKLFQVVDLEYYMAIGYIKRYDFSNSLDQTKPTNNQYKGKSDGDNFGTSAAIGNLSGNPLLGGSIGGSYAGGLFGSSLGE